MHSSFRLSRPRGEHGPIPAEVVDQIMNDQVPNTAQMATQPDLICTETECRSYGRKFTNNYTYTKHLG